MKLLISACLVGIPCRYDGASKEYELPQEIYDTFELVPFCPECYGGLSTPRAPSEIISEKVISKDGDDVTKQYKNGADSALMLCKKLNIRYALLKEKSPSCGKNYVYDGTFSKTLTRGNGITAQTLLDNGISVFGESESDLLLDTVMRERDFND